MNTYIRVRLFSVPANLEDIFTGHSFDCGATGVTEALAFSQPDLTYDPDIIYRKSHDMDVYFTEEPNGEFFKRLTEWNPRQQWEVIQEEQKDWLEEWKKGFVPFKLVESYWVVPTWHKVPELAEKPIFIDPGMAFGTGTHATTRMAAYFVNKLGKTSKDKESKSLADIGTGTAILAMLADKEGFGKVIGVEIDPEARRVARENILQNDSKNIEIVEETLDQVQEQFDFVVANIIDGVLIQIRPDLLRILKPGGDIFLTGILLEREETFLTGFIEDSGLKVIRRLEDDEWVGYWLRQSPDQVS